MAMTGPQVLGDGVSAAQRITKDGSQVNAIEYYELAYRGQLFILDSDSVTLAAANTTKSALGTIKFINGFYNPPSSGKNAVILRTHVSLVSGTSTGPFMYNFYNGGNLVTSAATGTIHGGLAFCNGACPSAMTPQVGVIIATTPASTPAAIQLGCVGGPAAVAAGAGLNDAFDDVRGAIVIPPNCLFGITQVGASTAVVQSTLWWAEIVI
jgi:hypothetical protein